MPVDLEGHLTEGSSVHRRALTPVIQTSHDSSLHYFSDSKRPRLNFDQSRVQTKTGGKAPGEQVAELFLRSEPCREMFYRNLRREFPRFGGLRGGSLLLLLFHFCGFQWPIILSHPASFGCRETPHHAEPPPPGQQRPHLGLPGQAPAKPCGLLRLGGSSPPLQQIPPAFCLCCCLTWLGHVARGFPEVRQRRRDWRGTHAASVHASLLG